MIPVLIALIVFALVGVGLSRMLHPADSAALSADTSERSTELLGQLRWRDFAKLVLQAMHGRGYRPVIDSGLPSDGIPTDGSDILLERGDELALLSCKYGSASTVGAQALLGLSQSAKLRGAQAVIVVTPGRFDEEAVRIAKQQNIELIDGAALWPEVRPYVARPKDVAPAPPAATSSRHLLIAWGVAIAAALVTWLVLGNLASNDATDADPAAAQQQAPAAAPPAAAPAQAPVAQQQAIPTDPAELDQRRREAASSISTLFGVARALWSTQSTLLVHLSAEEADPINEICPLLERYPELAASRIQLQPPASSSKPVRFKQCRTY